MPTRYYLRLPDPANARGNDPELAFRSSGADGFAEELQAALRESRLFEQWRMKQDDPDEVDTGFAVCDTQAIVRGEQRDLVIELVATTTIPGAVLKHRLRLLAGQHWQLVDVTAG